MEDFIFKIKRMKDGSERKEKYYASTCPQCLSFKGYVRKCRVNILCSTCSGRNIGLNNVGKPGHNLGKSFSKEIREKMSLSKIGQIPWNKGKRGVTEQTRQKMSSKKKGQKPNNFGKSMSEEQRIKISCSNQDIPIEEFKEFKTPRNKIERAKFYELKLHTQCFEKADFTCNKCDTRGTSLHAHHMNSWAFFEEGRYDLNNLVCLCNSCHNQFHSQFGNGKANPNTKLQYELFKNPATPKKEVLILTGAPASGKSWVASQLHQKYSIIDSDIVSKKHLVNLCETKVNPLLTLTVGVSTFIKNNPQLNCKLIVIQEDIGIINSRMLERNGKITSTIARRIARMISLSNRSLYSGSSNDVLDFLNKL